VDATDFGLKLVHWARRGFPELGDHVGMGIGSTTHHVLKGFISDHEDPHAVSIK